MDDAFKDTLIAVWRQAMEERKPAVELGKQSFPVTRTRAKKLLEVRFRVNDHWMVGIEQNPRTSSRWAKLARSGARVMQFIDEETRRYVAVVVDGRLTLYGAR